MKTAELLAELIRFRSVSEDIPAVNRAEEYMKNYLESEGIFCTMEEIGGRHVLYASTVRGKEADYLFNAHMDVVPAADGQFIPRIEGDLMYGRGTADCLGACAVIAQTLIRLKGKASCGAIFTADEEIGGSTTAGMVERGYRAKQCVVIIDAYYDSLTIAQKGVLALEILFRSRTGGGHASKPWKFDNPIDRLVDGYSRLRNAWTNPTEEEQWSNSMTPCILRGGFVHNQIPDQASMMLNIRFVDPEDSDRILAQVKELTGCDELRPFEICPPVVSASDTPAVQKLRGIMASHIGRDIPLCRMNGATDARHFTSLNVPLAIIGTCGTGEHSPCESVSLASLEKVSDILVDFASGK